MISKFSKMQNSIFAKIILTITALSFVSLFGVSSYISTANSNKAVIKVDDIEISQSEFSYLLQKELSRLNNLSGDDDAAAGERKKEIAMALAKAKLEDAVLENAMKKYGIDITDSLVNQIIYASPQFQANGQFDRDTYNWYLNRNNLTEKELIANIKRSVARRILVDSQVAGVKVPQVLQKQMEKILGQRRTFKYIKLVNAEAKIDREPTAEEIDQYYKDFGEEFTVPEKRDVTVMYLPLEAIENTIAVSKEEIDSYYKEHIDEYEQPEQRELQQLIFNTREEALTAAQKIAEGADFASLAADKDQFLDMGYVSADGMAEEMSSAFSLEKGQVSAPVEFNGSWMLLKVADIKPAETMPRPLADAKIAAELRQEKAYDGSYEIVSAIEDKIGAGAKLAEIAAAYNITPVRVNGLAEDGSSLNNHAELNEILHNQDVIDEAFSYNEGEVSRMIEGDSGFIALQVEKIYEPHQQNKEEALDKIKRLWKESEQSTITNELADNIQHDLEAGDSLHDVAERYGLSVRKTMPITRGETFDVMKYGDMKNLFAAAPHEAQIIKTGDDYVIAETNNLYDDSASLSEEEKAVLAQALSAQMSQEMAEALLKDYAENYDIEVNYNRMGLSD